MSLSANHSLTTACVSHSTATTHYITQGLSTNSTQQRPCNLTSTRLFSRPGFESHVYALTVLRVSFVSIKFIKAQSRFNLPIMRPIAICAFLTITATFVLGSDQLQVDLGSSPASPMPTPESLRWSWPSTRFIQSLNVLRNAPMGSIKPESIPRRRMARRRRHP
ncbi:hypothetical protein BDQ12DRAFT_91603 [Crucibulum laeve]|uniref:Uncharacterized protein n=1 Tax=Crucibulum laeve TaxID=68775 RepID=A0A5C3LHV7_9AGAR|nr:hypothetical protein BDQ12DRAFT_91603 [Crucibulum laeve]